MYHLYCLCVYHSSAAAAVVVVVVVVLSVWSLLICCVVLIFGIPSSFGIYCCGWVASVYVHAGVGSG